MKKKLGDAAFFNESGTVFGKSPKNIFRRLGSDHQFFEIVAWRGGIKNHRCEKLDKMEDLCAPENVSRLVFRKIKKIGIHCFLVDGPR